MVQLWKAALCMSLTLAHTSKAERSDMACKLSAGGFWEARGETLPALQHQWGAMGEAFHLSMWLCTLTHVRLQK